MVNSKDILLTINLSLNTKPSITNAELTKFVSQIKTMLNKKKELVVEVRKS